MMLRRPHWLREHATAPIVVAYVIAALVMAAEESPIATRFFGEISPMASDSAEAILSAIASGMMALTAILFSLLFVAIQVSGSFFGPRVVRFIGRTHLLGHALGIFAGTFVYALLAIRTIDIRSEPGIGVAIVVVAFAWLFGSIAVLLLLVLRLRRLEIADLLAVLYERTARAARRVYAASLPGDHVDVDRATATIVRHDGRPQYLLGFDADRLCRWAGDHGCTIHIPLAIGDPVVAGAPLAIVTPARDVDDEAVRRAVWLGPSRIIDNDPAYGIRLLVDIAIRALSPAVNDPTTAVTVLDQLDGLLRVLARLPLEDNRVLDAGGVVRLVFAAGRWDDLVALALTEIDDYGRDARQVQRRMASLLDDLADVVPVERRGAIARFAHWRSSARPHADWATGAEGDRQGLGHPAARALAQ